MVWQENVCTIVMLTKLVEKRVKIKKSLSPANFFAIQEQCHKYWPDLDKSVTHGEILIQTREEDSFNDHVERILCLTGRQGTREVLHLHYTAWPHQGVPTDHNSLAKFMAKVQERQQSPLLVHCRYYKYQSANILTAHICIHKI